MHDIFYFTDIHGQWPLYNAMINWCKEQDNECLIIYGGDACDRGNAGYRIMQHLLNDSQIIYLKGNHEDLFVKAAHEIIGHYAQSDEDYHFIHHISDTNAATAVIEYIADKYNKHTLLHLYNGGISILIDWLLNGASEDFIDQIEQLPVCLQYENIDFCHAGGDVQSFNKILNAQYNQIPPDYHAINTCLWDRNHWSLGWENNRICVHGHTPTIYLPARFYGYRDKSEKNIRPAAWIGIDSKQYQGWKIDMDTGATFTGRAYILNILTMQVFGFKDHNIDNNEDTQHTIENQFEEYKIID